MVDSSVKRGVGNRLRSKRIFFGVLAFVGICLVFLGGYSLGQRGFSIDIGGKTIISNDARQPKDVNLSVYWEAWNRMKERSVQGVDNNKMVEGSIAGMLSSLGDPYTVYMSKEDNKRFREDIQGEFSGIGVELTQKNELLTVVAPIADTPADKAGIKPNDIIVSVDGVETSTIGFEGTIDKIRGVEGTKVTLKITREGVLDPLTFELTRAKITVKSVEWNYKTVSGKKILNIKVRQFGDDTDALFADMAKDAVKQKPDGIILDLRNDPGGYLDTAVNLASYFIKDGVIVSEKGKTDKDYKSTGNGTLVGFNVVVLANEGSASASEILAGALKDRKGSKIIGQKTFGKGSVQELIDLSDGSAVKITVAKWFTPAGSQINGEGIKPDIEIKEDDNSKVDAQLNRAEEFLTTSK